MRKLNDHRMAATDPVNIFTDKIRTQSSCVSDVRCNRLIVNLLLRAFSTEERKESGRVLRLLSKEYSFAGSNCLN